ncbi:MAG: hypothetical protein Q9164_003944 [Protoblastenia rupestris]
MPTTPNSLAILGVSHEIRLEAEPIFFGLAAFNLIGPCYKNGRYGFRNLQRLSRRHRRMIQHIDNYCCSSIDPVDHNDINRGCPPFDPGTEWLLFIKLLAFECTSLKALHLWAACDGSEGSIGESGLRREKDYWINCLFSCLKGLKFFEDLEPEMIMEEHTPSRINKAYIPLNMLDWIREKRPSILAGSEEIQGQLPVSDTSTNGTLSTSLAFLDLPENVRARIYTLIMLPPNERIHPNIRSWFDQSTRNIIPLFRTCRQIKDEAEGAFYGNAIFTILPTSPNSLVESASQLHKFFDRLNPRLRSKIRRIAIPRAGWFWYHETLIQYIKNEMNIEKFLYVLYPDDVGAVNAEWIRQRKNMGGSEWRTAFSEIENLEVLVLGDAMLVPDVRQWLERDLRVEVQAALNRRRSFRNAEQRLRAATLRQSRR